ncbi:MAG TPA: hypothetical protein VGC39_11735 [Candidatus Methylacidiphilales bacterium]
MKPRLLSLILLFGGMAQAEINYLVPYTLVTEKEAQSFIVVGLDEKSVIGKFGPPNQTNTGKDGLDVWTYLVNPHTARVAHSSYYGFEVFFKNKKVTYLGIVRGGKSN